MKKKRFNASKRGWRRAGRLGAVLLTAALLLVPIGCGPGPAPDGGEGGTELTGTIDIYLPLDAREKGALELVAADYRRLHRGVEINIETSSDPAAYAKAVEGILLAPDETKGDIVQTSVVNQYYGTGKLVDFTSYLSRRNPYGSAEGAGPTWRSMLEEDACRPEDNGQTIPSLSAHSNSLVAYYNQKVFEENGWRAPASWADLLTLLENAQKKGYAHPLAVNFDKGGLTGNNFEWLLRMYMDQYFRDMVETAHSQPDDYSYIEELDADWQYSPDSGTVDLRSGYTYNLSRLIDAYFNGDQYNATSARFADMMRNFYDLTRYASPTYTAARTRSAFHNGVLNIENGSQSREESAVVYLARMDYAADYQTSVGEVLGYAGGVMPAEVLNAGLGCFAMPAMTDHPEVLGGAPAAHNVRTLGGPDHRPVGLVNRGREKTELLVDFLMYWFSPTGMDAFYSYYAERGLVYPLTCLVKHVTIPSGIALENLPGFVGDCDLNPYQKFGCGYSEGVFESGSGGTVRDGIADRLRAYLTGDGSSWETYGRAIHERIVSGFGNYAAWKKLKFTSPAEAAGYFSVNPIKVQQ